MREPRRRLRALGRWAARPARAWESIYPVGFMALIYYLSSIPGEPIAAEEDVLTTVLVWMPPSLQNLLHVPVFALLSVLWCRTLRGWPLGPAVAIAGAILIAAGYGLFDEWHQLSVPGRYGSATDCVSNAIGAAAGAWIYARLYLATAGD
jgi:VanZ family protein